MNLTGIQNGALLQRGEDNFCKITLEGAFEGTPVVSLGALTQTDETHWTLTGIPAGGPYTLTITDETETREYTDLYVGDLWLLAGQSNMEGAGRMTAEDERDAAMPAPYLRAYYMDDLWGAAKPILHDTSKSKDAPHRAAFESHDASLRARGLTLLDHPPFLPKRAVGPGFFFAREMFRLTGGVPQGVIPAAVGGAPIGMWLPTTDGTENYYTAAVRRIRETGSNIRGVFWAQGEGNPAWEVYPSQIETIRADLCRVLNRDTPLPFVQMQSFRCTLDLSYASSMVWSRFREMQRKMPDAAPLLATIAVNDLELEDCIHLSSDSQKTAGIRAAKAMDHLLTGRGYDEPKPERIYLTRDRYVPQSFSELHIRYANLHGNLRSAGVPSGFSMRRRGSEEAPTIRMFQRVVLDRNEVILRLELPKDVILDSELWYGWGHEFYCNITDEDGRAIPAMGPVDLSVWLKGEETV